MFHIVKAMVFPVVMYGCETWTISNAEHQRNWCFWAVVLGKTLESHLDCVEVKPVHPKGNQSRIFTGCWSWNSNTLATWCKELTHWKRPWCWERLKAGGEGEESIRWLDELTSSTQWIWIWTSSRAGDGQGSLASCSPWGCKEWDITERLKLNWTEDPTSFPFHLAYNRWSICTSKEGTKEVKNGEENEGRWKKNIFIEKSKQMLVKSSRSILSSSSWDEEMSALLG